MIRTEVYAAAQCGVSCGGLASSGSGLDVRERLARLRGPASRSAAAGRSARGGALTDDPARPSVTRPQAPGPAGFADLFAAHEADVRRVCRRMLGGDDAAEDARSEVFLRARRAFDSYDSFRPFRPWLLSIAGHHCIDQLRRRATEQRVFQHAEPSDADLHRSPARDVDSSPLRRVVAAQEREAISRAIESLPLKYRLPLVLRYFSDYDYAAIAAALGVTPNQVGTLLFRAKGLLREQLREPGRGEDSP